MIHCLHNSGCCENPHHPYLGSVMSEPSNSYLKSLVELASESWRFAKANERVLAKLSMKDQTRFQSQLKWFVKKISGELESSGLKIIDLEGQDYDAGMAVSALNIDDFDESEELYIDQVLSPLIMSEKGIEQMGTVILGSKK